MKEFKVGIREVWVHVVTVMAEDVNGAIDAVLSEKYTDEFDSTEYSHNLGPETWSVEEI